MELKRIVDTICNDIINIMNKKNNNKSFLIIYDELLNNKYSKYIKYKIEILTLIPKKLSELGYEIDNNSNKLIKY